MKTLFNIGDKITAGDIASYIFDTIRPVAGYSLRKLSNISGPVIRARRGIDNKESDFYADEIEGGELQGFATNDGASDVFVTVWYDQFGNNNATQTTAADQPKIWDASTGLVTENGKPALDFDGVNDNLSTTTYIEMDNFPSTIIGLYNMSNSLTGVNLIAGSSDFGSSNQNQVGIGAVNGNHYFETKTPTSGLSFSTFNNYALQFSYSDITKQYTYINSLFEKSRTQSSIAGPITRKFFIGNTPAGIHAFNGNIQEILVYSSSQSSNKETIETNVNQYYIIFGPLRYNQRITEDSGTFALTDRYEAVYDEVTEIATPSLLCTCDAYKESTLTTYGTLYNIIPA